LAQIWNDQEADRSGEPLHFLPNKRRGPPLEDEPHS
jgi:hypothetical protein